MLDEALERFARTGPEFGGGLSNHGPMAAEALVRLGHADAVPRWVGAYLPKLEDAAVHRRRITDWRADLGRRRRAGDWAAYFENELEEAPWQDVLARWWPRLLPGIAAGATHGVIRTAHAVRGVAEHDHPVRRTELAHALAYWAAAYAELPGRPEATGTLPLDAAVAALPSHDVDHSGLIVDSMTALSGAPAFPAAVAALRPPADPAAAVHELTAAFAGLFLRRGGRATITWIHSVTAPAAVASIVPHLPAATIRPTHDALWHVGAAIHSAFSRISPHEPLPAGPPPGRDDLAERAVAHGDEHVIKLTEACLREHALSGDPIFLHAAAAGLRRLS
ncbi:questin oxidase family protein [Nonomuraea typhae]|uniref:Questin oxidase family protein n=1 Tax=Nonomuraea typhae TaxID=2603600 RepID=A0ABW7Z589_9ACTN